MEGLEDEELAQTVQEMAQQRGKPITLYESIAVAMAAKAKAGDVKAATFVRDSAGDKPTENVEIGGELSANSQALLDKLAAMNGLKVHEDGENNG